MEVKSGKMMKRLDFFFKAITSALKMKFFYFGQILFNIASKFAAHHEKSFVPAFSKVSIHLIIVESGKRNYCFEKMSEKIPEFNLDSKIGRNPVQACTR